MKGNIQRVREEVRGEEESRGRCELVDSRLSREVDSSGEGKKWEEKGKGEKRLIYLRC